MSDKPWPEYSYLEQAAKEARAASRRYWAKGGAADKKYPVAEDVEEHWPLAGEQSASVTKAGEVAKAKRRKRAGNEEDDGRT
jgi:hypothetical protein